MTTSVSLLGISSPASVDLLCASLGGLIFEVPKVPRLGLVRVRRAVCGVRRAHCVPMSGSRCCAWSCGGHTFVCLQVRAHMVDLLSHLAQLFRQAFAFLFPVCRHSPTARGLAESQTNALVPTTLQRGPQKESNIPLAAGRANDGMQTRAHRLALSR